MTNNRPHHHGHRQRLRQRFIQHGLDGFADYEVVELLLTLAIPRADVKKPAKALIARFGNLRGILDASLEHLQDVPGIGTVTPVALRIIREAASLYLRESAEQHDVFSDPDALSRFWRTKIGALPNEVFQVGYLDSGYRLLRAGVETLEEGTIDRAAVYPRRVIEAALRRGAAALVCAHNHPNGHVDPTEQDKVLTRARNLAILSQLLNTFQNFYHYTVVTYRNREPLRFHLFNSFFRLLHDGGINEYEDPNQPFPKGYVQVMTIHQAKGLEFPVVGVGSLDKQRQQTLFDIWEGKEGDTFDAGWTNKPEFSVRCLESVTTRVFA